MQAWTFVADVSWCVVPEGFPVTSPPTMVFHLVLVLPLIGWSSQLNPPSWLGWFAASSTFTNSADGAVWVPRTGPMRLLAPHVCTLPRGRGRAFEEWRINTRENGTTSKRSVVFSKYNPKRASIVSPGWMQLFFLCGPVPKDPRMAAGLRAGGWGPLLSRIPQPWCDFMVSGTSPHVSLLKGGSSGHFHSHGSVSTSILR